MVYTCSEITKNFMLPEIGQYSLILALCLAIVQAIIPLLGAWREKVTWMNVAYYTSFGQCFFIACSFFILTYAFIINDFSVTYVANNSNTQLPIIYRICAVWGAHEGSLLLWVFILSLWMSAVSIFSRNLPLTIIARVLAVLAMISCGFLLFLLTTSNPFIRLLPNIPTEGHDLNPLLQDPGLVIHPPMLYMGYVGFSVAFAFAIAALISGRLDSAWARWSRPWVLVAWCFLTSGIILGSWWAYRELGWGGWWFWDPVENASFLPWLLGTALLHSLIVTDKRQVFKAWTVLLAIGTFSLSLMGTFLVRSGVLISVHSFALDPARGNFMLMFLAIVIAGSLSLFAWRAHQLRGHSNFALFSRETLLLTNNIFLSIAMLTVLLGTLYPLIIQVLNLGKISVGPPYFNTVFIPLMLPMLFLMGIATHTYWYEMPITILLKRLRWIFLLTLIIWVSLWWMSSIKIHWLAAVGILISLWIILTTLQNIFIFNVWKMPRLKNLTLVQWGMTVAHCGVAICVIGITCTLTYSQQRDLRMQIGDTASVGPYQFQFLGVRTIAGANYEGVEAGVSVQNNHQQIALLKPQQRIFNSEKIALTKAGIDAGWLRDLYISLGEPLNKNQWAVRIYYKPFVRWIWFGGLMIILGGILALSERHYRMTRNNYH